MKCSSIELKDLGKKYQNRWIFKHLDFNITNNQSLAIAGPNGSGKSTLLKILSGFLSPSRGTIQFKDNEALITLDDIYKGVSFAAPYISLIDRFSLRENINFFLKFKRMQGELRTDDLIDIIQLGKIKGKELRFFSSGMLQRVKLALSICAESDILLLDEPSTNLDEQGTNWYRELIDKYGKNRILVIASNVDKDFDFCSRKLNILDFKK